MSASQASITGLILAGGLGRRMGGSDKGLVPLAGRPLVSHVIKRLTPQVRRVLINANRNADAYTDFGLPVLPDRREGYIGPLAGAEAGLAACEAADEWLITCPCDSPFLPLDLVSRLLQAALAADARVAMPRSAGQHQPVFLLLHRSCGDALQAYLDADGRRIDRWVFEQAHVVVDFDDCPQAFANINTLDELTEASAPQR